MNESAAERALREARAQIRIHHSGDALSFERCPNCANMGAAIDAAVRAAFKAGADAGIKAGMRMRGVRNGASCCVPLPSWLPKEAKRG
jgi:hypothetical protein